MIEHALPTVVDAFAGQAGIDAARIEPDKPLTAIPEAESIHLLRAIMLIEETFAVFLPDDYVFETATVRELADTVYALAARR